jgi:two-component system sensor histidine kinase DesK
VVAGGLQLRNSLAAARGGRPRGWPVTFTAQLALAGLPFLWFGWDWTTPGMWFVFASALMLLPRRLAATVVIVGVAGYEVAEFNASRAAGYASPQVALFMVYYLAIFVMGAAALYGSVRLVGILDDLFTARTDLAEQALARERFRVSRDLHDLLGQSLSAVSLKGDLAIALLPSDPAAAQREIESLTSVARSALHDMRAVARDEHDVSLRAETDSAGAVLAAAGITARIDAELVGLPPAVDAVLGWAVREGATNILRHSEATSCSVTGRRKDGRVRLEIVNDGARAGENPGAGTGLAGLADRARGLRGSATGEYRGGGQFRLLVELPEVAP